VSKTEIEMKSTIDVDYVDHMGSDKRIVEAMLVSTKGLNAQADAEARPESIKGRLNFLMRKKHGSPFECGALTVRVHAPIKVWREWHRHRIGFCLSGDTLIGPSMKGGRTLKGLHDRWKRGIKNSNGGGKRLLPSCSRFKLLTGNEETGLVSANRATDVWESGVKEVVSVDVGVTAFRKKPLKCSGDHLILTDDGWVKARNLRPGDMIAVQGRKNVAWSEMNPDLRHGIAQWANKVKDLVILPRDWCRGCRKFLRRDKLEVDHIIPVAERIDLALTRTNLQPMCERCHLIKSGGEQVLARRDNRSGISYRPLLKKVQAVGEEMTYDVSVEGPWHNFIADGVVVHNSYNEESGRYKKLDPVFWCPPRDRPMVEEAGFRPADPVFVAPSPVQYTKVRDLLADGYEEAYTRYEELLDAGVDKGLARDVLGVGLFSACYVTCNPRSLMAFLELRTKVETANHPSNPLWEIAEAARQLEDIFRRKWPLTYEVWGENGRESP
jgi:flavin-dependent thymidylate synthase